MQVKTVLNRVHQVKGFVYGKVQLGASAILWHQAARCRGREAQNRSHVPLSR